MRSGRTGADSSGFSALGTTTVFRDRGIGRRLFDAISWAFDVMLLWLGVTTALAAATGSLRELTMPPAAERAVNVIIVVGAVVLAVRIVRARVYVTATTVVVVNPLSTRPIPREDVLSLSIAPRKDRRPWPVEGRALELNVRGRDGRPHEVLCWAVGTQQEQALSEALGLSEPMPSTQGRAAGAHRRRRPQRLEGMP